VLDPARAIAAARRHLSRWAARAPLPEWLDEGRVDEVAETQEIP
jgi:hypothetical protein